MNDDPYAPPLASLARPPDASPPMVRPRQVTIAVTLVWLSFALGFVSVYLAAEREPGVFLHPVLLIVIVPIVLFSVVVNVLVYRGRNWARIVLAVFVVLGALGQLIPSDDSSDIAEQVLDVAGLVLEVVALYLLFSLPGAGWFRTRE